MSGNGSAKLGTVATVVAAANSTAQESSKEIERAMQISLRNTLGIIANKTTDGPMDDLAIMKVNHLVYLKCMSHIFFHTVAELLLQFSLAHVCRAQFVFDFLFHPICKLENTKSWSMIDALYALQILNCFVAL